MVMKLRSEHISQRLCISMIIIIVSLLFISVPSIVNSYQSYKRAERALIEVSVLRNVAELTNNISRERAPANQVMSSTPEKRAEYIEELKRYRANVDQQIEETTQLLNYSTTQKQGFYSACGAFVTSIKIFVKRGT